MSLARRYTKSVAFLRTIDPDWARLIAQAGPCRHDAKETREPYEALVRAIAYQQLTAEAGDAILGRLVGLFDPHRFLARRTSLTQIVPLSGVAAFLQAKLQRSRR